MLSIGKKIENIIRSTYSSSDKIKKDDLYKLLTEYFYKDLKRSTFYWRIHELKKAGVIIPIEQGVYSISEGKKVFSPSISSKQKRINRIINNAYKNINYCSWNSNWLNEFSRHQAYNNILILNIEKEFMKSVFNLLIDNSFQNLYIDPDQVMIDDYISENKDSVAIIPFITKSPVFKITRVPVPGLEKILVDTFCDNNLLQPYKGEELKVIFSNAFNEYRIDISQLINYSRRRKKEKQIKDFLTQNQIVKKDVFI